MYMYVKSFKKTMKMKSVTEYFFLLAPFNANVDKRLVVVVDQTENLHVTGTSWQNLSTDSTLKLPSKIYLD